VKSIQVDDEVYAFLQRKAVAFEETPGMTLRRILGLGRRTMRGARLARPRVTPGRKRPKADLEALVAAGALKPGETLELRDYQGRKIDGCEASVAGRNLLFNGKPYSMSNLAQMLLKRHGYESTSVRGPAFWFTKGGRSIKDLWDEATV
jgi:hypothetical protein